MENKNNKRHYCLRAGLWVLCLFVFVTLFLGASIYRGTADAATSSTINFQAKLMAGTGAIVPDGNYNVEFKLYNALSSSGSSQGSCTGDSACLWTETRTAGNVVSVANGYLTVNLGSVTSFPGTIDWDQPLYLSMNIGGTGTPSWDGEMSPRLTLTAVPYAFRAGMLATNSAGNVATLGFTTPTANRTILLPNEGGTLCIQSSTSCGFAASSGSSNYIQNTTSPQSANLYVQAASSGSVAGTFRANAIGSGDILDLLNGSGTTVASFGSTGAVLLKNSTNSATAFQVQPAASSTPVLDVDTTNSRVGIGNAAPTTDLDIGPSTLGASQIVQIRVGDFLIQSQQGAANGLAALTSRGSNGNLTLDGASGSALYFSPFTTNNNYLGSGGGSVRIGDQTTPSYKLDVAGDINSTTALRVAGTSVCDTSGSTGCIAKSGSGYYIHNQTTVQASNLYVQAATTGTVAGVFQAFNGGSGNILNLLNGTGTTVASFSSAGLFTLTAGFTQSSGAVSIQGNAASSVTTTSGALTLTSAASASWTVGGTNQDLTITTSGTGTLTLGTVGAGTVTLGTSSATVNIATTNVAHTVHIGDGGTSTTQAITIGSTNGSSSTTIQGGTGSSAINLTSGTNGSINLTANGTGNINFTTNSASAKYLFQNGTNSTTALQVKNALGTNDVLNVDTSNVRVGINTSSPGYTLDVLGDANITSVSNYRIGGTITLSSSALTFVSASTATIQPAASQTLNITGHNNSTWKTDSGTLTLQGNTGLTLNTAGQAGATGVVTLQSGDSSLGTAGNVTIDTGTTLTGTPTVNVANTNAKAVQIGNNTSNPSVTIDSGTGTIGIGTGAQARTINVGTGAAVQTMHIGDGAAANVLTIGSTTGAAATTIQSGTGNLTLLTNSASASIIAKSSTNSASAFQIQNSSSVSQLAVDTSNSRIILGTSGGDTTGTILILGNKTSYASGANVSDPTGVVGGMYYNSALGQFRCYEVDFWRDCIESVRTEYHYANEMIGVSPGDVTDTDSTGGSGSTSYFDTLPGETGHPGILQLMTSTSATSYSQVVPRSSGNGIIKLGGGDYWRSETVLRIPTSPGLSTSAQRYTVRSGFIDGNSGDGTNGCFFRYVDNVNTGKWQGACRAASTESTCDTTITAAVNTWYRLTVVANAAGSSVSFQVNGVTKCSITTNIPTTSIDWGVSMTKSVGTTSRIINVDYIDTIGELGTSR